MTIDFADYVERLTAIRQRRDGDAWDAGDLVAEFEVRLGRPADGSEAPTLGDLAREADVRVQQLSEWGNTSRFYPTHVRTFSLSWSHYNLARRAVGGRGYDADKLEQACDLLQQAVDQYMGIRAFERYLKGVYFEGPLPVDELPGRLRGLVPTRICEVWVIVKGHSQDE